MDIERLRIQAREFNKKEDNIISMVLGKDSKLCDNPPHLGYHSSKFRYVGVTRMSNNLVISSYTDKVSGIGMGNVVLYHDFAGSSQPLGSIVGVDTPNDLWVCLYTDRQTLPTVEDLFNKEIHSQVEKDREATIEVLCGTNFFFDKSGRFGRVVAIPVWIADNRTVIERRKFYNSTAEEMEPGNFEIVGIILDELREKLS